MFSVKGVLSLHSVFRVWTIQVSNLFRSPHFGESMSVFFKEELSRFSILTNLYRFYPSFSGSPFLDIRNFFALFIPYSPAISIFSRHYFSPISELFISFLGSCLSLYLTDLSVRL